MSTKYPSAAASTASAVAPLAGEGGAPQPGSLGFPAGVVIALVYTFRMVARIHFALVSLGLAACSGTPDSASPDAEASAGGTVVAADAPTSSADTAARSPAPPAGMVLVPAGTFLRGSPEDVGLDDEHPQRAIELDAFHIDATEVTQAAYGKCVDAGTCAAPTCKKGRDAGWDPVARSRYPVVCVDWSEARAFCAFVGKRLPTEAEWEKAARGAEGAIYPWGNAEPTCELANYADCDKGGPEPVGSYPKNRSPYGALDMAGNVWEWVADWHLSAYYNASPAKNPEGPVEGKHKVVRGGSFKFSIDLLTSAERTYDDPTVRYEHIGIRCAKDAN
jgi:formylglycine-generating enzyme required for sulfatase activity